MFGRIGWFLLGFAAGSLAMAALSKSEDDEEDFESIADELAQRFADLETEKD